MTTNIKRREMLALMSKTAAVGVLLPAFGYPQTLQARQGVVIGSVTADIGRDTIANGGNAVDGIVAAALSSGVTEITACGIGGYGGHMTIAMRGRPVTSIDFNSTAPAAARHDMFVNNLDAHMTGWLSAGVPGTLGGMQLALDRYGTMSFRDVVTPSIDLARKGFTLNEATVGGITVSADALRQYPASARLLLVDGQPPAANSTYRNPDLADLLQTLADENSVDSFYRGSIGQHIADAFQRNGGLVTADDMAAYHAQEVRPLSMEWLGETIYTAPLTAGGATMMEALSILRALDPGGRQLNSAHARLEALRIAWDDRLRYLGDPEHGDIPLDRLLSESYAEEKAALVARAVAEQRPVDISTYVPDQTGTIHLSAADKDGNFAALTLTHGARFGSKVTVPGLGLILGHGVSRFDPSPGHPNSPGPGKRPLHNMCPTIMVRDGDPWVALGARGGRRIPNACFDVVAGLLSRKSFEDSVAAPRMNTTGSLDLRLEDSFPEADVRALPEMGYDITSGGGAIITAAALDPATNEYVTLRR